MTTALDHVTDLLRAALVSRVRWVRLLTATLLCLAAVGVGAGVVWAWFVAESALPGNVISAGWWTDQVTCEPGTSKARRWDLKDVQEPRVFPIAQIDAQGALWLDFGEEVRHNRTTSPDVLRIASQGGEAVAVSFAVTGSIERCIASVWLDDPTRHVLEPGTERVAVRVSVPKYIELGDYAGHLHVHLAGVPDPDPIPMLITVRGAVTEKVTVVGTRRAPADGGGRGGHAAEGPSPHPGPGTADGGPEEPTDGDAGEPDAEPPGGDTSPSPSPSPTPHPSDEPTSEPAPETSLTAGPAECRDGSSTRRVTHRDAGGDLLVDLPPLEPAAAQSFKGALVAVTTSDAPLTVRAKVWGEASRCIAEVWLDRRSISRGRPAAVNLSVRVPGDAAPGDMPGRLVLLHDGRVVAGPVALRVTVAQP